MACRESVAAAVAALASTITAIVGFIQKLVERLMLSNGI